jgi:hypothetical protein
VAVEAPKVTAIPEPVKALEETVKKVRIGLFKF